jgi:opacity protein-like surface antigen
MKKLIIVFFITISTFSQVKYGAKGGLNLTDGLQEAKITVESFNQTIYINTSPKISFYLGGFVEFPINKKGNLFLKTELLYCQNGTNVDKKADNPNQDISITTNGGSYSIGQLNIPVLVKFVTDKKVAFVGGFYFGSILFGNAVENGTSNSSKLNIKSFDFGLEIGASYPINKKMSVELRYNRGITNLDNSKTDYDFGQISSQYYNRTVHLGVEYFFN